MFHFDPTTSSVQFKKGYKPVIIKDAQREVRDFYMMMCKVRASRAPSLAKAELLSSLGPAADLLIKGSPSAHLTLDCASRAYAALGSSLEHKTMYNMNCTLPAIDLIGLKGLPAELLTQIEASGRSEVTFLARES